MIHSYVYKISSIVIICLGLLSCSPNQKPIVPKRPLVNTEACKDLGIEVKNPSPEDVRSIIKCLNGSEGAIQPYQNLIDRISDQEIRNLIKVYKFALVEKPHLFKQFFTLLKKMSEQGHIEELLSHFSSLTRTGVLQSYLRLFSKISNKEAEVLFEEFAKMYLVLNQYDQVESFLIGLSNGLNRPDFRIMSYILGTTGGERSVELIANDISKFIYAFSEAKALKSTFATILEPRVIDSFRFKDESIRNDFKFFFQNEFASYEMGMNTINGFSNSLKSTDKPIQCFSQNGKSLEISNLLTKVKEEEFRRLKAPNELFRYFQSELVLHSAFMFSSCEIPNSERDNLKRTINYFKNLGDKGTVLGLVQLGKNAELNGAWEDLLNIKSPLSYLAAPFLSTIAEREAGPYFLDFLSEGLNGKIQYPLNLLINSLLVPEVSTKESSEWLVDFINQLEGNLKCLTSEFVNREKVESILELKYSLRTKKIGHSKCEIQIEEKRLRVLIEKNINRFLLLKNNSSGWESFEKSLLEISKDENRKFLSQALKSTASLLSLSDRGVGPLLNVLSKTFSLSEESPVQNVIFDLANQKTNFVLLLKTINNWTSIDEFYKALDFTTEIIDSKELIKLIEFSINLFEPHTGNILSKNISHASPEKVKSVLPENGRSWEYKGPKPSLKYEACSNFSGGIFENEGKNLISLSQCLVNRNSNEFDKGLTKVLVHLDDLGLLPDLINLLDNQIFSSDQVHTFIEELKQGISMGWVTDIESAIFLSGKTDFSKFVDPVVFSILTQSNSQFTLNCLAEVVEMKGLLKSSEVLLDAFDSKKDPKFKISSNFEMPISDIQRVKKDSLKLLKDLGYGGEEADKLFQRAIGEFTHRNDDYLFRQNLYEKYSDDILIQEIKENLAILLNYTNIEEFIKALKDLNDWNQNGELDIAKLIRWTISETRVIPFWPGPGREPEIRLVTPFDQLAILVQNADFRFSVAGLPFGHIGTYFQVEVAKSDDLVKTIKRLKSLTGVGIKATKVIKKKFNYRFRNMHENFVILEELAASGELKFFQRLYRAFYNSTPEQFRNKKDIRLNQMFFTHRPTRYAFFARLIPKLRQIDLNGILENFFNHFFNASTKIKVEDAEHFRETLNILLFEIVDNETDATAFDYWMGELFKISDNNKEGFNRLNTLSALFLGRLDLFFPDMMGLLRSINSLVQNPMAFKDSLSWALEKFSAPENSSISFLAHIWDLNSEQEGELVELLGLLMKKRDDGKKPCISEITENLSKAYVISPEEFRSFFNEFSVYMDLLKSRGLGGTHLIRKTIKMAASDKGMRKILAEILKNPENMQLWLKLSESGSLAEINKDLISTASKGELSMMIRTLLGYLN